jgi:hypothetical protein
MLGTGVAVAAGRGSVSNDGTIVNNGQIYGGFLGFSNAGEFVNNASGTFSSDLFNTAGTTSNRGAINGGLVIISGGTVALIGTGSIGGRSLVNLTGAADISGANGGPQSRRSLAWRTAM